MRYNTRKATIPSDDGPLKLLILSPKGTTAQKRPGVLWIHGGGYITGMPEMAYMSRAKNLVKKYGAVVVCPDIVWPERLPTLRLCWTATTRLPI